MNLKTIYLAFGDIETTGSNKSIIRVQDDGTEVVLKGLQNSHIIELGIVLVKVVIDTDKKEIIETKKLYERDSLVYHHVNNIWENSPQIVKDMHAKSGLMGRYNQFFSECQSVLTTADGHLPDVIGKSFAFDIITKLIDDGVNFNYTDYYNGDCNDIILVGKNPQFDNSLIAYQMPHLGNLFDYRLVDVSMFKNLFNMLHTDNQRLKGTSRHHSEHTALADCHSAQTDFKVMLKLINQLLKNTSSPVTYLEDLI